VVTAHIQIGGTLITSQRVIEYLGVTLDNWLFFREHLGYAHKKANETRAPQDASKAWNPGILQLTARA